MRGREFIRVAEEMELISRTEKGKRKEAWLRRAVNSIYYGVLHEVIAFFEENGIKVNRDYNIHKTARDLLSNRKRETGVWMSKLHKLRTLADYDIDERLTVSDYKTALLLAKLILKEAGR